MTIALITLGFLALVVAIIAVHDLTQRKHAVTRNFPVIGHFRYFFEEMGQPLRQYFFAGDLDERPYNRVTRSWVYASAKGQNNLVGFGSQVDHNQPGRMHIVPSMYPTLTPSNTTDADLPRPRIIGAKRPQPYQPRRFANISGMSYGALSPNAVRALSRGAKLAGCYMSTGEGSLSPYHVEGGCDILYQIGPAKFGCRTPDGRFDDEKAAAILALPQVKMVEIKLSQGAKPGKGGMLPKEKITEEIAAIRGIPMGVDCHSPNRFEEFDDAPSLLDFIERVRKLTGKPIGLKMVVGSTAEIDELSRATYFVYNDANRRIKVIDPLNFETNTFYDAAGNVTAVVDARGNATSYDYDALNRRIRVTDALGGQTETDLVLVVGSHLGDQPTLDWRVPRAGTRIVQIDADPAEIGRNYPNTLALPADPRAALEALVALFATTPRDDAFTRWAAGRVAAWRAAMAPHFASDAVPIRPDRLCAEITAALPTDAILVADTGYSGIWTATCIDLAPSQTYLRAAGSLGWSFPAAIGAKCACPERPVLCFSGDGAIYYHLTELETARRLGLPLVLVINNNSGFGQGMPNVRRMQGNRQGNFQEIICFGPTDFAAVAEAFGVRGIRVEDPAAIAPALKAALAHPGPVVVDVATDIEVRAPEPWIPEEPR